MRRAVRPAGARLLCRGLRKLALHIGAHEGSGVDPGLGSGAPPGDAWAWDLLALVCNHILNEFLASVVDPAQHADLGWRVSGDGLADRIRDTGFPACADGIRRIVTLTRVSYPAVVEPACEQDVALDCELGSAGMRHNHAEKEILPVL